jgi:hypothetical protein
MPRLFAHGLTGYGLTYCFGLYHYMYEAITEMLEHMMERSAAVLKPEKEGFLLKKSGSSWAKYLTFSPNRYK